MKTVFLVVMLLTLGLTSLAESETIEVNGGYYHLTGKSGAVVDGKLGVGTRSPQRPMHVINNSTDRLLTLQSSSKWGSMIELVSKATHGRKYTIMSTGDVAAQGNSGSFVITDETNGLNPRFTIDKQGRVGINTKNPTTRLFVEGDTTLKGRTRATHGLYVPWGSVGIGTTSPGYSLHVRNNATNQLMTLESNSVWGAGINFKSTGAQGRWYQMTAMGHVDAWKGTPGSFSIIDVTAAKPRLVITKDGNVGIGTNNPGNFRLAVEGTLGVRNLRITKVSPWPDYVFAPNYPLMPLHSLENHISQKGHLPGVPDAKEVESTGIDVGDMQAILLKKIEELTLYVIDQNKRLEAQQQEINQLKATR